MSSPALEMPLFVGSIACGRTQWKQGQLSLLHTLGFSRQHCAGPCRKSWKPLSLQFFLCGFEVFSKYFPQLQCTSHIVMIYCYLHVLPSHALCHGLQLLIAFPLTLTCTNQSTVVVKGSQVRPREGQEGV